MKPEQTILELSKVIARYSEELETLKEQIAELKSDKEKFGKWWLEADKTNKELEAELTELKTKQDENI